MLSKIWGILVDLSKNSNFRLRLVVSIVIPWGCSFANHTKWYEISYHWYDWLIAYEPSSSKGLH